MALSMFFCLSSTCLADRLTRDVEHSLCVSLTCYLESDLAIIVQDKPPKAEFVTRAKNSWPTKGGLSIGLSTERLVPLAPPLKVCYTLPLLSVR
jgi:hypothetical protein